MKQHSWSIEKCLEKVFQKVEQPLIYMLLGRGKINMKITEIFCVFSTIFWFLSQDMYKKYYYEHAQSYYTFNIQTQKYAIHA